MQTKVATTIIENRKKLTLSLLMIFLMISSTTLSLMASESSTKEDSATSYSIVSNDDILQPQIVTQGQGSLGQGVLFDHNQLPPHPHPSLFDILAHGYSLTFCLIKEISCSE